MVSQRGRDVLRYHLCSGAVEVSLNISLLLSGDNSLSVLWPGGKKLQVSTQVVGSIQYQYGAVVKNSARITNDGNI